MTVKITRRAVGFYRWQSNLGSNFELVALLAVSDQEHRNGYDRRALLWMESVVHALCGLIRSGEPVTTSIRWVEV